MSSDDRPGDAELVGVAQLLGTPLYAYDLGALRARVNEIRSNLTAANVTLLFATMANDRPEVLRGLAEIGVGGCVNSMPHFRLAIESGMLRSRIQFTSTGISEGDMRGLLHEGVTVNLDSLAQVAQWAHVGGCEAGLRVNAASLGCGLPKDRIGVAAESIASVVAEASRLGVGIVGLHVYLGTNLPSPDAMVPSIRQLFQRARAVKSLRYVNLGGGIGVDYGHSGKSFDLSAFGQALGLEVAQLRATTRPNLEVFFEPGRGLVADCGKFVTAVTDIKTLDGRRLAAVDGSVAVFPRPFHHPDTPHRVRCLTVAPSESPLIATIVVGRTTFSRDILGMALLPRDLRSGDLLVFDDAGAYSESMRSRFLGQPDPQTVFVG